MRSAFRLFACAVTLIAALWAPAVAGAANGQLAVVVGARLVTLNADGSGARVQPVAGAGSITELAFSPSGNRLAFVRNGELAVLEPATGRVTPLTSGQTDANPGWSADETRIAFRRGLLTLTVRATGGAEPQPYLGTLALGTTDIAWAPDLKALAPVVAGALAVNGLHTPPAVIGAPAWAPDNSAIAVAARDGLWTVALPGGQVTHVVTGPAGPPRWSPDSRSLLYAVRGELRTAALGGAPVHVLSGQIGAADWQPCTPTVTWSCESVAPPRCSATAASATTLAELPVDLPAPSCSDPAGRPLSLVVVKAPDRGTLDGLRYTPAPGFTGQDTVGLRVTNGAAESETVRYTLFVVPRPAPAPAPARRAPAAVQGPPYLSAQASPKLDRKRRVVVKVSCDQNCSLTVRLTAQLRSKRGLIGPQVKRSAPAQRMLTLRLRLPSKPRGTIKTAWITGRVRNAAGKARAVRLPVSVPS